MASLVETILEGLENNACGDEHVAAMKLAEAAPDLLAALELIAGRNRVTGGTSVIELQQIARAALAKAKGS